MMAMRAGALSGVNVEGAQLARRSRPCVARQRYRSGTEHMQMRGIVVLSMVLVVLLAAALALVTQVFQRQWDDVDRMRLTVDRTDKIRRALCVYARINNGNLPVPPTPLGRPNATKVFGWYGNLGVLNQLGLSVEDVTDGWGRLITVFSQSDCLSPTLPLDLNGNGDATDPGEANAACVVLISHGPSGRGGFGPQPSPGGQLAWTGPMPSNLGSPANGAGGEWRNTQSNLAGTPQNPPLAASGPVAACTSSPENRQNPDHPCHFDDVVRYFDGIIGTGKPLCP